MNAAQRGLRPTSVIKAICARQERTGFAERLRRAKARSGGRREGVDSAWATTRPLTGGRMRGFT